MGRPTGTVTFLLTDVERSSALWDERPAEMATALAEHDGIIRKAVEAEDGVVFSTAGDAFAAAFPTAPAATAAAMAIQRQLNESLLRVRMGLHTGVADERDGDYFGPTVNRAARLRDIAHGGQVVCSAATADLLAESRPAGTHLIDHGEHRLKDLSRPEHVLEVSGVDALQFPPLRSLDLHRNNLPIELTTFLGREEDVAQVVALVRQNRLVTLTGVGGVGKSRLALQAAAQLVDDFPDGIWFVELGAVSDPDLLAPTVGMVIDLAIERSADQLGRLIGHQRVLVILDNCEHLVDACAELIEMSLTSGPHGRVLATSREVLGIASEHVLPVRTLDADAARALFCSRATRTGNALVLDDTDIVTVDQICERLDGIPLAIELAAARIAHLSPTQILERLADRFRLLTGNRRGVGRQQTLKLALDWSHDLLERSEQALLRRLSVFSGPFTLEGAEAVSDDDKSLCLEDLASLVAKSLVAVVERERYRLLETVRAYAEGRLLEAGEGDLARARHRDWYLRRAIEADDAYGPTPALAREADDVASAVLWSLLRDQPTEAANLLRAMPVLFSVYRDEEVVDLVERVLEHEARLHPDVLVALLTTSLYPLMRLSRSWLGYAERATEVLGATSSGPLAMAWAARVTARAATQQQIGDVRAERELDAWREMAIAMAVAAAGRWPLVVGTEAAVGCMVEGRYAEAAALYDLAVRCPDQEAYCGYQVSVRGCLSLALHYAGAVEESLAEARTAAAGAADVHLRRAPNIWAHVAFVLAAHGDVESGKRLLADARLHAVEATVAFRVADCLIADAGVAALDLGWERSARTLAAARRANGDVWAMPWSQLLYRRTVALVRANLDGETARRCRDEGRAMTLDEAVAYAAEADPADL